MDALLQWLTNNFAALSETPYYCLLPALWLGYAYALKRRLLCLIGVVLWLTYPLYEIFLITCKTCQRPDLSIIIPVLIGISFWAVLDFYLGQDEAADPSPVNYNSQDSADNSSINQSLKALQQVASSKKWRILILIGFLCLAVWIRFYAVNPMAIRNKVAASPDAVTQITQAKASKKSPSKASPDSSLTPLMQAVLQQDDYAVEALLSQDAPVNARSHQPQNPHDDQLTALHLAVRLNNANITKRLLQAGADPLAQTRAEWSPAAFALATRPELVKVMLATGALKTTTPISMTTPNFGYVSLSPLMFAIYYRQAETAETLVKAGADYLSIGPFGYPAGHFAAYYGDIPTLKALARAGIDLLRPIPDGINHAGETFLMHAAEGGSFEAVDYLLSLGARKDQRDKQGRTAADHAKAYSHLGLWAKLSL
jgi:ankyrin repeat protein